MHEFPCWRLSARTTSIPPHAIDARDPQAKDCVAKVTKRTRARRVEESGSGRNGRGLTALLDRAITFELAIERPAIESEDLGRERLVAADGLKNAEDVTPLHFFHREELRRILALDDDP